ncbi:hypothetical protein S83_005651 [Arachis hypogaea]
MMTLILIINVCNSKRSSYPEGKSIERGMEHCCSDTIRERQGRIGICGKGTTITNNNNSNNTSTSDGGEILNGENFLGVCSQELLAKGSELLKQTRKGDLH